MTSDFFMCYFNIVLNKITFVNIASKVNVVLILSATQKRLVFFSFLLTQK